MQARGVTTRLAAPLLAATVALWLVLGLPEVASGSPCVDGEPQLVVMSENIYLGADAVPVVRAALLGRRAAIVRQVTQLWQDVRATNFPERADAIARQIINHRADFVALQEVALFRTGIPDGLDGNYSAAEQIELDYLQILLDVLACYGTPYTPVAVTVEADLELPGFVIPPSPCGPGLLRDIRFTDRLAILVRSELLGTAVQVRNPQGGRFHARVTFPIGFSGDKIKAYRGWNAVDVDWGESSFRLINMCLETNPFPLTQTRQAQELLHGPACTELSVILVGDSNSDANRIFSPAYHRLIRSGYRDAWNETHRGSPGIRTAMTQTCGIRFL